MEINKKKIEIFTQKITDWKNKLIDISRRNRLLNFKATKVTTVKIIDKFPNDIFKSLIIDGNSMYFTAYEEQDNNHNEENEEIDEYDTELYHYKYKNLEEKSTDLNLQTKLNEEHLQKNLKRIYFKSQQIMEEQGYNILYLTLGMLEWFDAESSNIKNKSPLIMIPVELKRRSISSEFKMYSSDEDPFINPALQYKLKNNFNLLIYDLPEDHEKFDLQEYVSTLKEIVKIKPRWKITDEIYLGLFSFAKFVMFKELERYFEFFENNNLIQALAGVLDRNINEYCEDYITAEELDEKREPSDVFQVLDADSSQQEAIEAIKAGYSIITHGPPGTGKSQTITNVIAESLACGKKILFVSEKMAALDVVYNRLKEVGIEEYCLEIHSRKANKKHILNQLKEAYECRHPGKIKSLQHLKDLVKFKDKLIEYSSLLYTTIEPFGKTIYWLIGQLNHLRNIAIVDLELTEYEKIKPIT